MCVCLCVCARINESTSRYSIANTDANKFTHTHSQSHLHSQRHARTTRICVGEILQLDEIQYLRFCYVVVIMFIKKSTYRERAKKETTTRNKLFMESIIRKKKLIIFGCCCVWLLVLFGISQSAFGLIFKFIRSPRWLAATGTKLTLYFVLFRFIIFVTQR